MSLQQIAARHGVHSPDWRRIRRVFLFVLMLPVVLPAAWVVYVDTVLAYSASFHIDESIRRCGSASIGCGTKPGNSGAYVSVTSPRHGHVQDVRFRLGPLGAPASTWRNRNIAVLGTDSCDYLVSPTDRTVTPARNMPSDNWNYLGAFDLKGGYGRALRFVPAADQGECIQMTGEQSRYDWMVRRHARQGRCH